MSMSMSNNNDGFISVTKKKNTSRKNKNNKKYVPPHLRNRKQVKQSKDSKQIINNEKNFPSLSANVEINEKKEVPSFAHLFKTKKYKKQVKEDKVKRGWVKIKTNGEMIYGTPKEEREEEERLAEIERQRVIMNEIRENFERFKQNKIEMDGYYSEVTVGTYSSDYDDEELSLEDDYDSMGDY